MSEDFLEIDDYEQEQNDTELLEKSPAKDKLKIRRKLEDRLEQLRFAREFGENYYAFDKD